MNRLLLAAAAAALLLGLPATASAQNFGRPGYYNPYLNQPRLSPYLDIVGRGNNPAVNYYNGTLSEIERRNVQAIYGQAINTLQREEQGLAEAIDQDELAASGHITAFNNTAGYFPTSTTGRAPGAAYQRPASKRGGTAGK